MNVRIGLIQALFEDTSHSPEHIQALGRQSHNLLRRLRRRTSGGYSRTVCSLSTVRMCAQ